MRKQFEGRREARYTTESGLTLVELMVSMAVGLIVLAIATALFVSVKSGYVIQTDSAQILDTGRHVIDVVSRTVREASILNWDTATQETLIVEPEEATIFGMDATSLKSRTVGLTSPVSRSVNGSDVLAVRFFGAGEGSNGDGSVLNCAGFGVGTGAKKDSDDRGWSIFYVAEDATGEPELYCKYPGEEGWASQAIARGVESLQVLYALDTDGDGYPNTLLNASAIDAMGNAAVAATDGASKKLIDGAKRAQWKNVVAIKVSILVRGTNTVKGEKQSAYYDLFGEPYSNTNSSRDKGVRIRISEQPKAVRNRARKVFSATVWLRNRPTGE